MHTFCVFMRKKCDICRSALRILVQNFLELGKKAVFADGVDLEKDALASTRAYAADVYGFALFHRKHRKAYAVAAHIAVTLVNAKSHPSAGNIIIRRFFKACRYALADVAVDGVHKIVKIAF